jgi:uncharacterized membrane protein (GlpM family)
MIAEPLFWYGLVLKMAMTAAIVVSASVAAERSGPFTGALIAALPTAAGAAYIILALQHPANFIAASAVGSVAVGAAVSIFAATYSILAQRHGLVVSLGSAFALWFAVAAALRLVDWTPLGATAVSAGAFAIAIPLTWRYRTSGPPPRTARRAYDIPLRAFTAALVVALVTTASSQIGSFVSGMLAIFPVVLGSFVLTLHPRVGGKPVASVLAHAQPALIGLGLGFLVVHYLAEPLGSWGALLAGLVVCLAWSALLLVVSRRKT